MWSLRFLTLSHTPTPSPRCAEAAPLLRKVYFSGGTVTASIADMPFHQVRPELTAKWEDGTLPFLEVLALKQGVDILEKIGMSSIFRCV